MSCLGDPSRFQLVSLLVRGQRCVSELAQEVGLSQSCTTRHLQALQREQMVRGKRDGKRVMFRLCLEEPEVRALLAWAISERAAGRGDSTVYPLRGPHGADLHVEGPPLHVRKSRPRSAAGASHGKSARRADLDMPADPPVAHAVPGGADPNPPVDQEETPQPAPRRPPRNELEDFLL